MAARTLSIVIALFVLALQPGNSQAQLLAEVKNFLTNLPTFGSSNVPNFSLSNQRLIVQVPAVAPVPFGTVNPQTGTWEYRNKALGAGVEVGPNGASLIAAQGPSSTYNQVTRIGPDGLVVGPDSAGNVASRSTADQPVVDLSGIKNVKLGPNGLQINPGSSLNSTVQLSEKGLQLSGNPTGTGETHLFIKPNFNLGRQPAANAGTPAAQPNNVQVSVGDGKSTATQQLQGYTNYQLNPSKGTYTKVGDNGAPPFMGTDPDGRPYTSYAARAPAPGPAVARMSASQVAAAEQGMIPAGAATAAAGAPSMSTGAAAPLAAGPLAAGPLAAGPAIPDYDVVSYVSPRQTLYGGDLYDGTVASVKAYREQVLGESSSQASAAAAQEAAPYMAPAAEGPDSSSQTLTPAEDGASSWSPDAAASAPAAASDYPDEGDAAAGAAPAPAKPSALLQALQQPSAAAPAPGVELALAPLDVDSYKKKKKKHHKHKGSSTPPPHSKKPPKHKEGHNATANLDQQQENLAVSERIATLLAGHGAEVIGDEQSAAAEVPTGAPADYYLNEAAVVANAETQAAAPKAPLQSSASLNKAGRRMLRSAAR